MSAEAEGLQSRDDKSSRGTAREVIVRKPATYHGVKYIEIEIDPFIGKAYEPTGVKYVLRQHRGQRKWDIYRAKATADVKTLHKWDETLLQCDIPLKTAKAIAINELQSLSR